MRVLPADGYAAFRRFLRLPREERKICMEAALRISTARIRIRLCPFRKTAAGLGRHMHESPREVSSEINQESLKIKRSIRRAARLDPRNGKCLAQALAGKKMLQKRRIPSTLYLGVARTETGKNGLKAHAWLRCGDLIVSGEEEHALFTVVSIFGDEIE